MNMNMRKIIILIFVITFAVIDFGNVGFVVRAQDEEDVLKDINKVQDKIEKEEKELQQSQASLSVTQSQINATANQIDKTEEEISRKEKELENLKTKIALNKKILTAYTQEMQISDQDMSWALKLSSQNFSQYFQNFDQVLNAKEKLLAIMNEIKEDKEKTEVVKEELAEKKEEHEELLAVKQSEKNVIVADINETKLTISQLQAKMSKLRSTLSKFLGSSYDMDDVVDAVKYADKKTGVRKEFLFAMLDKETDLGRFTGGCYYDKGSNPVKKHMKSADKTEFIKLMDELGYGKNDKKLSCWPGYGYGGAMGIAQFMPSTWIGYKSSIASMTGNKPANPWRLEDGVMGMALKLKKAGADKKSKEHYAAKLYYCGGPSSPYWSTKCEAYADTVVSWSKGYDEYF
jgi:membrane-bound lytic murein transglycosylase B